MSTPAVRAEERLHLRAAVVSLVVGTTLLGVKYLAWLATHSSAVLADALESIVNVVAAIFAVTSILFSAQPADRNHPYGHGKIEFFSAVFEGGLIAFAALMICWTAVVDLWQGPEVRQVELGLALTTGAGIVNAALGWWLLSVGRRTRSVVLVADGQHVLSDFWTSAGVVVGLLLVRLTGLAWIDPLVAAAVGANLGVTGARLVREAAGALLDEEDAVTIGRLVRVMDKERDANVIDVHRLRAIRFGRRTHVDAHVIVPEYWTVERAHEHVESFGDRVLAASGTEGDVVLHVDPCRRAFCTSCGVPACPVRRAPQARTRDITVEGATRFEEPDAAA